MASDDDIWKDDLLGRKSEAEFLLRFLNGRLSEMPEGERHFVLNVNAEWGHGKTFFLDRVAGQLQQAGHIVARVDAWQTDYATDPILPVMAAIEDAVTGLLETEKGTLAAAGGTINRIKNNAGAIAIAAGAAAGRGLLNRFAPGLADDLSGIISGEKNKEPSATTEAIEAAAEGAIAGGGERIIGAILDREAKSAVDHFRQTANSTLAFKSDLASLLTQANSAAGIPFPCMSSSMSSTGVGPPMRSRCWSVSSIYSA